MVPATLSTENILPRALVLNSLRINKLVQIQNHAAGLLQGFLAQKRLHLRQFVRRQLAAQRHSPSQRDLFCGIIAGFAFQSCGEVFGLLVHEVAVEQAQRLRGDGGDLALGATADGVGEVEGFEHGDHQPALDEGVDAAARGFAFVGDLPDFFFVGVGFERGGGNAGLHRGAETLRIELAADGEHGVADGFDLQAPIAVRRRAKSVGRRV